MILVEPSVASPLNAMRGAAGPAQAGSLRVSAHTLAGVGPPSFPIAVAWPILASAFFGAFFAFLFARLGEWLAAKLARGKVHRNSLARLERVCVDYLNDIITSKRLVQGVVDALTAGVPYWQFPHAFAIERSFSMEILDLDLAMRVTSVNTVLRRFNWTVEDFQRAHNDVQRTMLSGRLDPQAWADAVRRSAPLWNELLPSLNELDDQVRDLATRAVMLVRQYDSRRARVLRAFGFVRCWHLPEDAVARARQQYDAQRATSLARNDERMRGGAGEPARTPGGRP